MILKQNLRQSLKQKQTFNQSQKSSLDILSLPNDKLHSIIIEMIQINPFITVTHTSTSFLTFDETILTNSKKSLKEVLIAQLSDNTIIVNKQVALFIIENLNHNGFLTEDISELARDTDVSEFEIINTLTQLKTFEPTGVFAANEIEAMILQAISAKDRISSQLLLNHQNDILHNDYRNIATALNISVEGAQSALKKLRIYNPYPCSDYDNELPDTLIPDIDVVLVDGELTIKPFETIQVACDDTFFNIITKEPVLKKFFDESNVFIANINKRNATLLLVVQEIINWQAEFFLFENELVPLTQSRVADSLGINQSTVSRTIANKHYRFNGVIYPLDKLLPSETLYGDSSDAIKKAIRQIISEEDKVRPKSDDKIQKELLDYDFCVPRRTIAKYRDELNIPNSRSRKKYD